MRTSLLLTALLAGLAATGAASAGTITGNTFQVTADVAESCTVDSGTDIAFGTYDPLSATPLDAQGTIVLRCVNGTDGTVELDGGQNDAGGCARRMSNGSDTLPYGIFKDAGHVSAWGCGAGTGQTFTGLGPTSSVTLTTYGRIPVGQNADLGNYTDVVGYTVTF